MQNTNPQWVVAPEKEKEKEGGGGTKKKPEK
jgi:hypothetical protein